MIISRRPVNIDNNTGAGGLAGVGAGAVAGSQIGGSGAANVLGAIGGAVAGGLLGNAIEEENSRASYFTQKAKVFNKFNNIYFIYIYIFWNEKKFY